MPGSTNFVAFIPGSQAERELLKPSQGEFSLDCLDSPHPDLFPFSLPGGKGGAIPAKLQTGHGAVSVHWWGQNPIWARFLVGICALVKNQALPRVESSNPGNMQYNLWYE